MIILRLGTKIRMMQAGGRNKNNNTGSPGSIHYLFACFLIPAHSR